MCTGCGRPTVPAVVAGTLGDVSALAAAAGAALVGGAGLLGPRAVAALPRPRDLPPGEPGPDYPRLAAARGLGPAAAGLGGLVGALLGWRLGIPGALPFWHLAAVGLVLAYVDVAVHRLPDALVLPSLVLGPLLVAACSVGDGGSLARAVAWMGLGWAAFRLLHAVQPAGLGRGDVKLAAWTGLVTAWLSWPALVLGVVAAVGLGGVVAVAVLLGGGSRRTAVPFGPMLLAGAVAAALVGDAAVDWLAGG